MNFISCDQSYANFAMVAWEDGQPVDRQVVHSGSNTQANLAKQYGFYSEYEQEQLQYIYEKVKDFVEQYEPEVMVFEGLSFGSKGDQVFNLGGLYYHVTTSLVNDGLIKPENIYKVSPQTAKKHGRQYLNEEDAFEKTKDNVVVRNKNGTPKPNSMSKQFMKRALENTKDGWLVHGYSTSSKVTETGAHDIPDAYWIGKAYLAGEYVKRQVKKTKKNNKGVV